MMMDRLEQRIEGRRLAGVVERVAPLRGYVRTSTAIRIGVAGVLVGILIGVFMVAG